MNKIDVVYIPTHGTKEEWETVNPLVPEGALCTETDTGKIKVGDGKKRWRDIPYAIGEPGAQGKAFRFEDFTEEQLNALKIKGDKGESAFELWKKTHDSGTLEEFLTQLNVRIEEAENAKKLGGKAASVYALQESVLQSLQTVNQSTEQVRTEAARANESIGTLQTSVGEVSQLQTQQKTSLVAAINELSAKSVDMDAFFQTGSGSFAGNNREVTIPHGKGKSPKFVEVQPSQNPGGYLGEIWVRFDQANIYIGNSGSFTGGFSYLAYF